MNRFRNRLPPLATLLPFEAVVRLGAVSRAAEELGLTQAAVSRQIRHLEENLGLILFERRNRAVHATPQARELAGVIGDSLERMAAATDVLRHQSDDSVILFAQLCEGLYWVMPNLSDFYRQHPGVDVRVTVSPQPVSQYAGHFDVALQTSGRDSGGMTPVFTMPDEVFPVCAPALVADREVPISLTRLNEFNLLHHRIEPQDWVDWDEWLERIGSETRVGFNGTSFDSFPLMVQAALEGHGICLGWRQTSHRLLEDGQLVRPFAETLLLESGLAVYVNPGIPNSESVEKLCQWLRASLSDLAVV